MDTKFFHRKAEAYLRKLCLEIPSRRVGSEGNRSTTDFFAERMRASGFEVDAPEFDCIDWFQDEVALTAGGKIFEAFPSPYSLGCRVNAPLVIYV